MRVSIVSSTGKLWETIQIDSPVPAHKTFIVVSKLKILVNN